MELNIRLTVLVVETDRLEIIGVNDKCHYAECHYTKCHSTECRYAECHSTECRYAECRSAVAFGVAVLREQIST